VTFFLFKDGVIVYILNVEITKNKENSNESIFCF